MGLPSSVVRQLPIASKFSSENPIGSMILWQLAHGSFVRCISICWRMVGLDAAVQVRWLAEAAADTFGGGGGGSTPRKTCITVLPRCTGGSAAGLARDGHQRALAQQAAAHVEFRRQLTRRKLLP